MCVVLRCIKKIVVEYLIYKVGHVRVGFLLFNYLEHLIAYGKNLSLIKCLTFFCATFVRNNFRHDKYFATYAEDTRKNECRVFV
jgi:hypothetical protein